MNELKIIRKKKDELILSDSMLLEQFPDILCIKDEKGCWLSCKPQFLSHAGLSNESYQGKTDQQLMTLPGSNIELLTLLNRLENRAIKNRSAVQETILLDKSGKELLEIELSTFPLYSHGKTIIKTSRLVKLIVTGKQLSQPSQIMDRLYLLDSMFSNSHLSFIILDAQLNIINVNKAFLELTSLTYDEVYEKSLSIISIGKRQNIAQEILDAFKDNEFDLWEGEIICRNQAKGAILTKLEVTRIINEDNITINYFATLSDITSQKKNEKRIRQIAHYDNLTSLSNRVLFLDRFTESLSDCKRHKKKLVIFFIDLDKFKEVNDNYGHDVGDKILQESAKRFLAITRKEDVVARFSGDEFAIMFVCEKKLGQILYEISIIAKKIIAAISQPFIANKQEIFIGSSIGVSIYPEHGTNVETLLKKADIAMYEAKNKGRNNFQFYRDEFSIATNNRLEIEKKLRKAIDNNELELFFQPQFRISDNSIWGAEVLVRWFENSSGYKKLISPDIFIPIAEDTGMIVEIGQWILKKSCQYLKTWINMKLPINQISVNVSARQFTDKLFIKNVEDSIKSTGINSSSLELEITESMLIGDIKRIELQLKRLKSMGVNIALDDFGTGYSSLSYLKNFPIDVLKIDQSFIRDMTIDSKDAKISRAIIEMGHSLEQKIIAEGVENEEQLTFLLQHRCDIVQGYLFSKPLPAEKMLQFLNSHTSQNIFL
jgi:diguanylate cyclase (GGDEF)-like protein/PAS domain S-box-containing protein